MIVSDVLYFSDIGRCSAIRAEKDGTLPVALVTATGTACPRAIAVDDTNLYWVTSEGSVASVPKTGRAVTPIATSGGIGLNSAIAVDATNASVYYWEDTAPRKLMRIARP